MLTYWRIRKLKKGSANSDSIRTSPKVKQDSDTVRGNTERVFGVYACVCFLSLVHSGYMEDI